MAAKRKTERQIIADAERVEATVARARIKAEKAIAEAGTSKDKEAKAKAALAFAKVAQIKAKSALARARAEFASIQKFSQKAELAFTNAKSEQQKTARAAVTSMGAIAVNRLMIKKVELTRERVALGRGQLERAKFVVAASERNLRTADQTCASVHEAIEVERSRAKAVLAKAALKKTRAMAERTRAAAEFSMIEKRWQKVALAAKKAHDDLEKAKKPDTQFLKEHALESKLMSRNGVDEGKSPEQIIAEANRVLKAFVPRILDFRDTSELSELVRERNALKRQVESGACEKLIIEAATDVEDRMRDILRQAKDAFGVDSREYAAAIGVTRRELKLQLKKTNAEEIERRVKSQLDWAHTQLAKADKALLKIKKAIETAKQQRSH
jgi:hypothetical protein